MSIVAIDWMCKDCKSRDIIEDYAAGDMVCRECGLVAAERIFQVGEDERHFEEEDNDRTHTEATNKLLDDIMASTKVTHNGTVMASSLRQFQHALKDDHGLLRCFSEIQKLCDKLNIPNSCHTKAQELSKLFWEVSTKLGKRVKAIAAASVYISAVYFQGVPITFKELAAEALIQQKQLWKYTQKMITELRDVAKIPLETTKDFITRYIDALDLPYKVKSVCDQALERARNIPSCAARAQSVLAVVILWMVCVEQGVLTNKGVKLTLAEFAEVSNVSAVTIKNQYERDLFPHVASLLAP